MRGCSSPPRARGCAAAGAVVALLAGLVTPLLVGLYYADALGQGPLALLWSGFLAVAGGHFSLGTGAVLSLWAGTFAALIVIVRARRRVAAHATPEPIQTRGPVTLRGAGLARRHRVRACDTSRSRRCAPCCAPWPAC